MILFIKTLALTTTLGLAVASQAQGLGRPDTAQVASELEAFLLAHHEHRQFHGAVLVADQGEILYQGAFGTANESWDIPNRIDTKFRIGAITKQFTAMLTLVLVEEGVLALDEPIRSYLPDYPEASGNQITVHHLLNHTSGVRRFREHEGWQEELTRYRSVPEFVDEFCSGPLDSAPGTDFRYSYGGYYLLGAIIEAATGETFAEALRQRVLDPLDMRDTGYEPRSTIVRNHATGYEEILDARYLAPRVEMCNHFASSGLYSTVEDLWKWDRALHAQTLLSGELERLMFTPGKGDYGYGWHVDDFGIWHGGLISGFSSMIGRQPSHGRCVILLSNSGFAPIPQVALGIGGILEGRVTTPPGPRPEHTLASQVLNHDIDAGLEAFAALPKSTREREVEITLNILGYQLLEHRRMAEAIRLFEFNTRAFPLSSNAWDSLGDAHIHAGNRQLAIQHLERALKLDPWNPTAAPLLQALQAK